MKIYYSRVFLFAGVVAAVFLILPHIRLDESPSRFLTSDSAWNTKESEFYDISSHAPIRFDIFPAGAQVRVGGYLSSDDILTPLQPNGSSDIGTAVMDWLKSIEELKEQASRDMQVTATYSDSSSHPVPHSVVGHPLSLLYSVSDYVPQAIPVALYVTDLKSGQVTKMKITKAPKPFDITEFDNSPGVVVLQARKIEFEARMDNFSSPMPCIRFSAISRDPGLILKRGAIKLPYLNVQGPNSRAKTGATGDGRIFGKVDTIFAKHIPHIIAYLDVYRTTRSHVSERFKLSNLAIPSKQELPRTQFFDEATGTHKLGIGVRMDEFGKDSMGRRRLVLQLRAFAPFQGPDEKYGFAMHRRSGLFGPIRAAFRTILTLPASATHLSLDFQGEFITLERVKLSKSGWVKVPVGRGPFSAELKPSRESSEELWDDFSEASALIDDPVLSVQFHSKKP